ncbi:hypothetical protein GCM10022408_13100 [Hymenobacter fastidiosus]|uniref:Uncharacterized protein n=1 Tax=Hymenobacter fastidiosus TaxID=486264 RepID=A0ABP7RVS0_9BACT
MYCSPQFITRHGPAAQSGFFGDGPNRLNFRQPAEQHYPEGIASFTVKNPEGELRELLA